MVNGESYDRLVELAYSAAEDPGRWRSFCEELQAVLGAKSIHVLGFDHRHGALSYSDGANLPVEGELAYLHRYRQIDPRWDMLTTTGEGQWLHFPEMLAEGVVARHPLYQEFLLPYDRRYATCCKLVDTPEATIVFSVLNGDTEGPLTREGRAFLDRLLPHMQRACRMGLRGFVYSTQALVGHLLVDRMRQPVILMTPGGEVIHTNAAAADMLRATRLVQVADRRLVLPRPQLAELRQRCGEMEQAMKVATPESMGAMEENFQALLLADGADTAYLFFTMLSPQRELGTFGLRPVVMLMFYHPSSAPPIDGSLLYTVFGLTPAESRIATLLAEGLSLKQIAQLHGTQHDTVRKQLRAIYDKTSTRRQPELIRLLLHLPHFSAGR